MGGWFSPPWATCGWFLQRKLVVGIIAFELQALV